MTICARPSRGASATSLSWNPRFVQLRGHYAFHATACTPGDAAREGVGRGRGSLPQDRVLAGAALRARWSSSTSVYADWRDRVALPRRHATGRHIVAERLARRARGAAAVAADRFRRCRRAARRGCRSTAISSTPAASIARPRHWCISASSCASTATTSGSSTAARWSRATRAATSRRSGSRRRGCVPSRRPSHR